MNNIHVRRFSTASDSFQGLIEPEDRSWIVLIDDKGEATFWRHCAPPEGCVPPLDPETATHEFYVDAELPGGRLLVDPLPVQEPPKPGSPRSLDFTVVPTDGCDVPSEGGQALPGYWARLNARDVACFGETEHLALKSLLNYVAALCTAGCLDHTGRPMPGHLQRRYDAVFGATMPESPSV